MHYEAFCPICKKSFAKNSKNGENRQILANNRPNFAKNLNILNISSSSRCTDCESPFLGLWGFGWREGTLKKMIVEYKYNSVRALSAVLVELLDAILPRDLAQDMVVVPLPTIGRHIRERGFDHTLLLAKELAKRRGWRCEEILVRAVDTVQVGAKAATRKAQASKAYVLRHQPEQEQKYFLLDDVWTTGSTLLSAGQILREAGARNIYAGVVAVSGRAEG